MMPAIKKAFILLGDDIVDLSTENDALDYKRGSYDEKWLEESEAKLLKQIDDEKRAILKLFRMNKQMNKQKNMADLSYNKFWETEFDNIVSQRDKLQDLNIYRLKLEILDTHKKDEKIITNFEPIDDSDVINKSYLDENLTKIDGHLSILEKDCNEYKLQYNKQSVEEIITQRAVETTLQLLYDERLFDNYNIAEEVLEDFRFTRKGPDLVESK